MYCVKTQLSCDVLSLKSHTLASYAQKPPKVLVHCNIRTKTNTQVSSGKFNNLYVLVYSSAWSVDGSGVCECGWRGLSGDRMESVGGKGRWGEGSVNTRSVLVTFRRQWVHVWVQDMKFTQLSIFFLCEQCLANYSVKPTPKPVPSTSSCCQCGREPLISSS